MSLVIDLIGKPIDTGVVKYVVAMKDLPEPELLPSGLRSITLIQGLIYEWQVYLILPDLTYLIGDENDIKGASGVGKVGIEGNVDQSLII